MATRSDFADDEWEQVTNAIILAAAVISAADDIGEGDESETEELLEAFRESLPKLADKYKKSDLVQDVLGALESAEMDEFWAAHGAMGAAVSHEHPLEDRIKIAAAAGDIVDRVADRKETKAYKGFLYDAARAVASASKESFFALSSSISKKEDFYLRQLRSALRI